MPLAALRVSTSDKDVTLPSARPAVIGRSPESDVVVRGNKVSRQHVRLDPGPDGWVARDLSANGMWHEGERVPSLRIGSAPARIRLGAAEGPELTLTVLGPALDPKPAVDDDLNALETQLAPNTAGSPINRRRAANAAPGVATPVAVPAVAASTEAGSVAAGAGSPPLWLTRVPTLIWLFAAAFTIGALIAVS